MNQLFEVVAVASVFAFLSVLLWSLQRRREREAYYRYELARQLMSRSETPDAAILEWVRTVETVEEKRRRSGTLMAALVALFAGIGSVIPAGTIFDDEAIPGLMSAGVGVALFAWLGLTRKRAAAALLLVFASLAVHADLAKDIETIAREEMERLKLPALQIAVAQNGKLLYSGAFGLADLEQNVRATRETRFRTASVAKSLTATAVLQLAEENKLDLDAPASTYCPSFTHPVTIRQLLAHTSGVRHYSKRGESGGTQHYFTITDSLELFKNDPLLFEPGTKHGYSTYAYSVLGCAIEGASKMPFDQYMATRVFTPAGMTHTGPDHHYLVIPQRASFYQQLSEEEWKQLPPPVKALGKPGQILNANFHDTSMKRAGGGLLSTAEDLVRFAQAYLDHKLLRAETVNAAWTPQRTSDGNEVVSRHGPFGLGWIVRERGTLREIYTSGGQVGARASMHVYPHNKLAVAVMTNLENAAIIPLEERILKLLMPGHPERRTYEGTAPRE